MKIMGVDPGVTGGVAVLDGRSLVACERMPILAGRLDVDEVVTLLTQHQPDVVVIEKLTQRPRGGTANWSLGWNSGSFEATVTALSYPLVRILPVEWKRTVGLPHKASKGDSRLLAKQLWPDWADSFRLVKDDGKAEAALIAEAHRNKENNNQ